MPVGPVGDLDLKDLLRVRILLLSPQKEAGGSPEAGC
jgi:hypothetical protein